MTKRPAAGLPVVDKGVPPSDVPKVDDGPKAEADKPKSDGDKAKPEAGKPKAEGNKPKPDGDKPDGDKPKAKPKCGAIKNPFEDCEP
jgi:hypothetical protein